MVFPPAAFVIPGQSRPNNGVAEFTLGLAEGKTRGPAYAPGIHVVSAEQHERRGWRGQARTSPA
jgi:hypothetical protein